MYKSIRLGRAKGATTVLGLFAGETALPRGLRGDAETRRMIDEARRTPGFKADLGEVVPAGDACVLVGLGKPEELDTQALHTLGARLVKKLDRLEIRAIDLALERTIPARRTPRADLGRALAIGMGLANWRVDFFDGSAAKTEPAKASLTIAAGDAGVRAGLKVGLALAAGTNEARRIAATPPNICDPTWMAAEARRLARATGLSCRVLGAARLAEMGMGGITSVGAGSDSTPCLITLEHKPARPRTGVKLVLVGKTITFDTGGYSLKPAAGMKGMKYDKCGGCAVLGAMHAIAALKLPVHVVALLPTAENKVSDASYRPDDIITLYNGVSVEVTNTDAEGRLVLADALAYACARLKPTAIIDVATLTGGVVVALGSWCAGIFGNDEGLLKRLDAASAGSGEKIWRLPLWEEHRSFMRAKHADIWNSGPKRDGHPIQGAAFLSFFVDESIPWAHVDIAGVSSVDADQDLLVAGPTGFGVRLLTEVVRGYSGR